MRLPLVDSFCSISIVLENEVYVILRDKAKGYESKAVAASKNRQWVDARMNSLPANVRDQFHVRPVRVEEVEDHVVVFYDRWSPGGDWALSGFSLDPNDRPKLPLEPEERMYDTLMLNEAPESIFGKAKKKAAAPPPKRKRAVEASATPIRARRYSLSLALAILAWVCILAALMLTLKTRMVVLTPEDELPEGMRFPIAYKSPEMVEHGGWYYLESELAGAALERTHEMVGWRVIGAEEPVQMRRPRLLDAEAHVGTEAAFIYGRGNVDSWRDENFQTVTDGYVARWGDGSVMAYDLVSNRIYGRITLEVARELFSR